MHPPTPKSRSHFFVFPRQRPADARWKQSQCLLRCQHSHCCCSVVLQPGITMTTPSAPHVTLSKSCSCGPTTLFSCLGLFPSFSQSRPWVLPQTMVPCRRAVHSTHRSVLFGGQLNSSFHTKWGMLFKPEAVHQGQIVSKLNFKDSFKQHV